MDWHGAMSTSGERPAVHPDCRRPIKISYVDLSPLNTVYPHSSPNYFYCWITGAGARLVSRRRILRELSDGHLTQTILIEPIAAVINFERYYSFSASNVILFYEHTIDLVFHVGLLGTKNCRFLTSGRIDLLR
ncbi:hypothetical protein WH47_01326 [Habropoda laboriosa]|uniref:Uncharacterized protein n=1 Tax=Habropoda laboriosa TaxID=597456 RepID=A0A0L7R324_9HYME|nr:hypothetical protein WH47_01326 [Habropoda laboriosa]